MSWGVLRRTPQTARYAEVNSASLAARSFL
jgi:hypothetical protein